jgi:hypothetical protein
LFGRCPLLLWKPWHGTQTDRSKTPKEASRLAAKEMHAVTMIMMTNNDNANSRESSGNDGFQAGQLEFDSRQGKNYLSMLLFWVVTSRVWRQYVSPKRCNLPVSLYGVTTQNNDIFTAIRTSNLTIVYLFMVYVKTLSLVHTIYIYSVG